MKIRKIFNYIIHPSKIFVWLGVNRKLNWIPDETYLKIMYKLRMGKKLDLENPKTFNEKLQWLKLYDRKDIYTTMVDKYEAKKYVADIIGDEYIIPTLGVWDSFDQIDFDKLPKQFVLKCTHDSGGLVICKDKKKLDIDKARKKIEKSLKRNYYYLCREWPYKNVKPRIIAEKFLVDESKAELKDYKIFCFNGEAKFIQLDFGRFVNHKRNIYDVNWNLLNLKYCYENDYETSFNKPSVLNDMLYLSKKICKNKNFLRIDFYITEERIYFGEITFYPEAGYGNFIPKEYDLKLGNILKL